MRSGRGLKKSPVDATLPCRTWSPRLILSAARAISHRPFGCSCSTSTAGSFPSSKREAMQRTTSSAVAFAHFPSASPNPSQPVAAPRADQRQGRAPHAGSEWLMHRWRVVHGPCVRFEDMPGCPKGFRLLLNMFAGTRRNMTLGFPDHLTKCELSDAYREAYLKEQRIVPHVIVDDGPVFENVMMGDEVDV